MFLLGAVTLCCTVVAGTLALLDPVVGQVPERRATDNSPARATTAEPVRVVGAPFMPNVKPRER
ncbi:hypothetical protein PMI42_04797 [Bradyrhizobium sp. YR681]|uniref:hypothetical protein n=1 Tax=Bradyrhizobium sp. YR681 TaxID=1144344 RepID=UPI00027105BD|nr:hypothetical protein [Bradyrhizobium sp. YR681]EJN11784.1 hypothetical protein PMI42_04797 [Bradyrhizobium sp. YR681]